MLIGYARTSTLEQVAGLEAQMRDLKAAKCERIFSEQLSSVESKRDQLEAAIDYCRDGDILVCTKLDRLARSVADVVAIEARLRAKGAALHIMDPAMDTSTPAGRLTFNVLASIAQFEREIMLTRQREGIEKAKLEGKFKGRKPTSDARKKRILELHSEGMQPTAIANLLSQEIGSKGKPMKICRRTIHRILSNK